jgi:hypothetical protein
MVETSSLGFGRRDREIGSWHSLPVAEDGLITVPRAQVENFPLYLMLHADERALADEELL